MLGDPQTLALLSFAGLLAGMLDAVAGGGGLIALPALLAAGIPPHLALGTNKLAGTFGTFSAARAYIRRGLLRPREWPLTTGGTFLGAVLGSLAVSRVPAPILERLLPPVIAASAIYVALRRRPSPGPAPTQPARDRRGAGVGAGLGFYDGCIGPGTGAFWTTAALALFHMDLVRASGVARFMNFVSNGVALGSFMLLGLVDYVTGLIMGLSLMAGAWIGAHSAIRYGAPLIRPVFLVVVLALAGTLAWRTWA